MNENKPLSLPDCADLLFVWLTRQCGVDARKEISDKVGDPLLLSDSSSSGILIRELVFLHTSIIIDTVNRILAKDKIKTIIDLFLDRLRINIMPKLEQGDPAISDLYSSRLKTYFDILGNEGTAMRIPTQFLLNVYGPRRGILDHSVISVANLSVHFGITRKALIDMLGKISLVNEDAKEGPLFKLQPKINSNPNVGSKALRDFEREISSWPPDLYDCDRSNNHGQN